MLPGVGECRVRHLEARSCATLDIQVAHKGSGYVERAYGMELDRTRRGVVSDFQYLANFEV